MGWTPVYPGVRRLFVTRQNCLVLEPSSKAGCFAPISDSIPDPGFTQKSFQSVNRFHALGSESMAFKMLFGIPRDIPIQNQENPDP